jgi:hypothetical protein
MKERKFVYLVLLIKKNKNNKALTYVRQYVSLKEISSMDFLQHGKVFYFYNQALPNTIEKEANIWLKLSLKHCLSHLVLKTDIS